MADNIAPSLLQIQLLVFCQPYRTRAYRTATPNDWFIAGDSGAGYLNPNLLVGERLGSGLPDALDLWVRHNQYYFQRFDYDITGFVINGFYGDMPLRVQEAYTRFSPRGVGMQLGFEQALVGETPFIRHASDIYPRDLGVHGFGSVFEDPLVNAAEDAQVPAILPTRHRRAPAGPMEYRHPVKITIVHDRIE